MNRLARASMLRWSILAAILAGSRLWAGPNEPCHVGVQLHLHAGVPEETYMRHVRAFVEEDMADYVMLLAYGLPDADRERVAQYLAEHKIYFLLQENFDPTKRTYDAGDVARLKEIGGAYFLGLHWGEMDSSGLKPEEYLPEALHRQPNRPAVEAAFVGRVKAAVESYHALGAPFAHSCATLSHAAFAEAGTDILCSEIGENIPAANMMIASNRGAARAYGKPWMIDHSTWWGARGNAGSQVSPREGHTPWLFFTHLLGAAMGGADYAQLEVDWAAYDQDNLFQPGKEKPGPLLPWGQALKTLYSVTRAIGPRGDTVTPFAVLLGHENGWPGVGWRVGDVRNTGLFDGLRHAFMQTRDADLSLKILDVFYPGFERCGWDPEYPGFVTESPLGTLDIVTDDLAPAKLARYKVLVALGYHRWTEGLCNTLTNYVREGGTLICGDTLLLDEQEKFVDPGEAGDLLGCVSDLSEEHLTELRTPKAVLDPIEGRAEGASREEWQSHWLHPVRLTSGRVVARMDDQPYIVENILGQGRVYFITTLNLVGNSAERRGPEPFLYANLLYHFLHTLEAHVGDGIDFSPWTSLEHIYSERPDGTGLLLVMNHGDMACRRDASLRNPQEYTRCQIIAQGTWEHWTSGGDMVFSQTGNSLAWSFDMPPKSFAIFRFVRKL